MIKTTNQLVLMGVYHGLKPPTSKPLQPKTGKPSVDPVVSSFRPGLQEWAFGQAVASRLESYGDMGIHFKKQPCPYHVTLW